MREILLTCATLLFIGGCTAKISGSLSVDGQPFAANVCRSGQAFGFNGIELSAPSGQKLRLFANPEGTTNVAIFPPGTSVGTRIGNCGTLAMHIQSSRINNVQNLMGEATLDCKSNEHTITGDITFKNCH